MDLVLERIELRSRRRPAIDRRRIGPQRPTDRIAIDAKPPRQLLDRHPADEVLAPQLGPPLHVQHPSSRPRPRRPSQAQPPPGRLRHTSPTGVKFQPAKGGEYSGGADTRHKPVPARTPIGEAPRTSVTARRAR